MRPTWKAATIVEPLENVSGSTSVWWLVVAEAAQVAWVKGSVLMVVVAARAERGNAKAMAIIVETVARIRCKERVDRNIFSPQQKHNLNRIKFGTLNG